MAEPDSASLAGALDRVLDKGIVVDVQARVSLAGIDVMAVEGQVVAASLETYYENREEIAAVERAGPGGVDDAAGAPSGVESAAADVVESTTDAVESATDVVESATNAVESTTDERSIGTDDESADSESNDETDNAVPEGKVRCRECGEVYEAITPSHLSTHDMSIVEYRETYGDDVPMNFGGI